MVLHPYLVISMQDLTLKSPSTLHCPSTISTLQPLSPTFSSYLSSPTSPQTMAREVAGRIREAQLADKNNHLMVARPMCSQLVNATMKDIVEAEHVFELMRLRVERQTAAVDGLRYDIANLAGTSENALESKFRDELLTHAQLVREQQKEFNTRRVRDANHAIDILQQLKVIFGTEEVAKPSPRRTPRPAAVAATTAITVQVVPSLLVENGSEESAAAAADAATLEEEQFMLSFLETQVTTQARVVLDKRATVAELAAAVRNSAVEDKEVGLLLQLISSFLAEGTFIVPRGQNPAIGRFVNTVLDEVIQHRKKLIATEKAAQEAHVFVFKALKAVNATEQVQGATAVRLALWNSKQRIKALRQLVADSQHQHKEMKRVIASYRKALANLQADCGVQDQAFRARTAERKKNLVFIEETLRPHLRAAADINRVFSGPENQEIILALQKADPALAINGGWSKWASGFCDARCGLGRQRMYRTCDSPQTARNGMLCQGPVYIADMPCSVSVCNNGLVRDAVRKNERIPDPEIPAPYAVNTTDAYPDVPMSPEPQRRPRRDIDPVDEDGDGIHDKTGRRLSRKERRRLAREARRKAAKEEEARRKAAEEEARRKAEADAAAGGAGGGAGAGGGGQGGSGTGGSDAPADGQQGQNGTAPADGQQGQNGTVPAPVPGDQGGAGGATNGTDPITPGTGTGGSGGSGGSGTTNGTDSTVPPTPPAPVTPPPPPAPVRRPRPTVTEIVTSGFVRLPKLDLGEPTPDIRPSTAYVTPDGRLTMVSDNDGFMFTYAYDTSKSVWNRVYQRLRQFQVGFGQDALVSQDGQSAIVCSKWHCSVFNLGEITRYDLKTNQTGTIKAWQLASRINEKPIRFPRPVMSKDRQSLIINDRCNIAQFSQVSGSWKEQGALKVTRNDCRAMGWGLNYDSTTVGMSADGRVRVLVGSCARDTFCNVVNKFSIVYVFKDGKKVARVVVPTPALSRPSISDDGSLIVIGAPVHRTTVQIKPSNATDSEAEWEFAYIDPVFKSQNKRDAWAATAFVGDRAARATACVTASTAYQFVSLDDVAPAGPASTIPAGANANANANATAAAAPADAQGANSTTLAFLEQELERSRAMTARSTLSQLQNMLARQNERLHERMANIARSMNVFAASDMAPISSSTPAIGVVAAAPEPIAPAAAVAAAVPEAALTETKAHAEMEAELAAESEADAQSEAEADLDAEVDIDAEDLAAMDIVLNKPAAATTATQEARAFTETDAEAEAELDAETPPASAGAPGVGNKVVKSDKKDTKEPILPQPFGVPTKPANLPKPVPTVPTVPPSAVPPPSAAPPSGAADSSPRAVGPVRRTAQNFAETEAETQTPPASAGAPGVGNKVVKSDKKDTKEPILPQPFGVPTKPANLPKPAPAPVNPTVPPSAVPPSAAAPPASGAPPASAAALAPRRPSKYFTEVDADLEAEADADVEGEPEVEVAPIPAKKDDKKAKKGKKDAKKDDKKAKKADKKDAKKGKKAAKKAEKKAKTAAKKAVKAKKALKKAEKAGDNKAIKAAKKGLKKAKKDGKKAKEAAKKAAKKAGKKDSKKGKKADKKDGKKAKKSDKKAKKDDKKSKDGKKAKKSDKKAKKSDKKAKKDGKKAEEKVQLPKETQKQIDEINKVVEKAKAFEPKKGGAAPVVNAAYLAELEAEADADAEEIIMLETAAEFRRLDSYQPMTASRADAATDAELDAEIDQSSAAHEMAEEQLYKDLAAELEQDRRLEAAMEANFVQSQSATEADADAEAEVELESEESTPVSLIEGQSTTSTKARALATAEIRAAKAQLKIQMQSGTVVAPQPEDGAVNFFFGNRVAVAADGSVLCVQSLRNGRVTFEFFEPSDQGYLFDQRIVIPWSTAADFRTGFSMSATGTVITMGTNTGDVAFITRKDLNTPFVIPAKP